ncbi:dead deah box helicase domain-containing protein [Cystoisospora suis]|uniref:Dead deah box helicase domain-containing protein n=1 Tax=Cystoisospora suis TaxID=483139 RepID=A0A2C6LA98_9APIC|nr:dead deah box helicase domain-containing protein [Cystoisospora suis]
MYTGRTADVLLMSATPIPRTQVLLKYGDLQLSRIGSELIASSRASAAWTSTDGRVGSSAENEEGPCRQLYKTQRGGANRIPAHNVSTYLIDRRRDDEVTEMMRIVKEEVRKGRQVFWVCPLVSVAPGGTTPETKRKPCSLRRGRAHNEPSGERSVRRREKSACAPGKSETEESELAEADNLRAAESPTEAENGEEQDAKKTAYITEGAAVQKFKELKEILPDMRIRLLHGRMKTEEKLEVLNALRTGAVDLLVATTVVEVGIDVPNATVIVIDNAERFGLTQLHQLRGRVGRDSRRRSFCFLLIDRDNKGLDEKAMRRFAAISTTTDGFVLAETDAELRGGGTLFGKRQHGQTDVWLARGLKRNEQRQLLEHATDDAEEIIRVYGEMRQDQQLHNEKRGDSEKIVVASDELPRDCCADQGSLRQGEVGNKVSAVHVDDTDEQCSSENPSVQRTSGDGCAVDKPAVTKSGGPARRLQLSPKELQDVEELVNEVKRIVPPAKVDWLFKV